MNFFHLSPIIFILLFIFRSSSFFVPLILLSFFSWPLSITIYFLFTFVISSLSSNYTHIYCFCIFVTGDRVERAIGLYWSFKKSNWGTSCSRKGNTDIQIFVRMSIIFISLLLFSVTRCASIWLFERSVETNSSLNSISCNKDTKTINMSIILVGSWVHPMAFKIPRLEITSPFNVCTHQNQNIWRGIYGTWIWHSYGSRRKSQMVPVS